MPISNFQIPIGRWTGKRNAQFPIGNRQSAIGNRRCARAIAFSIAILLAIAGCERSPQIPPDANSIAPSTSGQVLRLSTIAPLQPARQTHFAVDSIGNVLWVQESDPVANDVVYMLGSSGAVPQATRLTSANILFAMNAARDAAGNIQSIAAAPDGGIFFYFAGGKDAQILCCVGWFLPRTGEIRILSDTNSIQKSSGMVASLALARGSLIPAGAGGSQMWLWLGHTDGSAILRFTSRPLKSPLEISRPFTSINTDGGRELMMTPDTCRLRAGPEINDLILIDLLDGALWQINAAEASAKLMHSLVGLPRDLSSPAALPDGRTMFFAADAKPIKERSASQIALPIVQTDYPALLMLDESRVTAIPRDRIRAYAGFAVYQLELTEFVKENPGQTWITYDRSSGELLRARIE